MAQFMKQAFQLTPNQVLYQQKRFRGKINIRKPRIFYKKAVVNELVKPVYVNPNAGKSLDELCFNRYDGGTLAKRKLSQYEKIISLEVRNWLDKSRMVACLHVNSILQRDVFDVQVPLFRANMYLKRYGSNIVLDAIRDSPHEDIAPLIGKYTWFVFSPDINVVSLQKIIRSCKKMYTLGGILEGHVLKLDDFLKYGQMDLTSAQLGLVQTLQNAGGGILNHQLTHHQSTLVSRLDQIGTNETTSTNETVSNENE